ncbi:MAG: TauD/TfdA family dioxygenase [Reyranella sp.]|uniref:TauD/TfdA family dioxygenase n=1 Tax=Reyranella sp. TaxID=1929291 RepID=UPI001ACC63E0|nr:TauD/TfdA family dioxygenase [Reyranella sp.]MBN9086044.1 TauD/TfdA family dioxygenase [Reyranella sp.]
MTQTSARAVPQAWTRDTIAAADWTVTLTDAATRELLAVRDEIRRAPVPTFLLDPKDFALEACRAVMTEVRRVTQSGPMFAVLDRLPMAEIAGDEAIQLYWLLSSLLARPVAQKITGQMFYDVMDTGVTLKPGSGIRPTVTNVDLRFHNDNSYNETPPDYVCLLCLHPAKEGGISQVMSVATVHEALQHRHPELMARLYRPFWYDRHAEHHPGEPTTFGAPMFERGADGTIKARLALSEIHAGYELRGERMDNETAAALAAVQSVFDRPELHVELGFAPGQIQFVNNRATGHARTEFTDFPEPERKRHLVRLWLRDAGKRGYCG